MPQTANNIKYNTFETVSLRSMKSLKLLIWQLGKTRVVRHSFRLKRKRGGTRRNRRNNRRQLSAGIPKQGTSGTSCNPKRECLRNKLIRYEIFFILHIARHSLDFSVSSLQDDERRRDYRVEDRNSRELAHKRTQAHTRT